MRISRYTSTSDSRVVARGCHVCFHSFRFNSILAEKLPSKLHLYEKTDNATSERVLESNISSPRRGRLQGAKNLAVNDFPLERGPALKTWITVDNRGIFRGFPQHTHIYIQWIVIYSLESTIQVLNNWTLGGTYILEATPTLQNKIQCIRQFLKQLTKDSTSVLIGLKPMVYCAGKLIVLLKVIYKSNRHCVGRAWVITAVNPQKVWSVA